MGDFNARLARVGDKKPNVIATAEFENLLTCNLDILNEKFAKGVPTFVNISDEKKGSSIILKYKYELILIYNRSSLIQITASSRFIIKRPSFLSARRPGIELCTFLFCF